MPPGACTLTRAKSNLRVFFCRLIWGAELAPAVNVTIYAPPVSPVQFAAEVGYNEGLSGQGNQSDPVEAVVVYADSGLGRDVNGRSRFTGLKSGAKVSCRLARLGTHRSERLNQPQYLCFWI